MRKLLTVFALAVFFASIGFAQEEAVKNLQLNARPNENIFNPNNEHKLSEKLSVYTQVENTPVKIPSQISISNPIGKSEKEGVSISLTAENDSAVTGTTFSRDQYHYTNTNFLEPHDASKAKVGFTINLNKK
ncbi:hypothetical protein [Endomicrobium proavitum]|uniref:Uncharacterized protein n=1 Tax=Endomicrobium proavitum TaxID=1408281 RepID=A0A0G3WM30_9BACT|nr:hypothetical protein [Endomicrobium proavitum]AKL98514.1 exported protein of unknown function [Endomicrobium proavitum]